MEDASPRSRVVVGAFARDAVISASIGIAFFFLIFLSRQELWSWRLALYGAVGGFAVHAACHSLDAAVGTRIRRRGVVPDRLVGVPLYFIGGSAAFFATTALFRALRLLPFEMSRRDMRIGLFICGGFSIVVGLIFYSFNLMRERLRQSVERIKEAEFAEKELELARDIQSRLLPPPIVEGEGFRVSARNLAARFVAGDFYDVFHLADGKLGLVIADVSGKGIGASLIMASVKAVVPLMAAGRSAAETLTQLNRKLFHELAPREFVALCYARFDVARGTLEIANAGLPDPYRVGTDGTTEALSTPGSRLPLGARGDIAYESLSVQLDRTDRVLFVTDGLPEAPTAAGDPLGYETLAKYIASAANEEEFLDRLFAAVRTATSDSLDDDWTALLLERRLARLRANPPSARGASDTDRPDDPPRSKELFPHLTVEFSRRSLGLGSRTYGLLRRGGPCGARGRGQAPPLRKGAFVRQIKAVPMIGIVFLAAGAVLAQAPPPKAPVKEVVETYFGQKVVDPYRWMEETKSPEMVGWMKAQNDYTRAVLEKIPARAGLAQRIKALDNAGTSVSAVQWVEGRFFYFKTEPGSDNRKLYVREGLEGSERLLLDPEKLSTKEKHHSIDYFVPSLDGRYVAAGVSVGGSENSVLEVLEAATGKELPDRIDRAQFGAVSWRKDGKSFFYNRLARLTPQSAPTDRYLKSKVFLHVLGSNPEKDAAILGFELSRAVSMTPEDIPFVAYSPASQWLIGIIAHGVQNERTLYAARIDSVVGAAAPWRKVADVDDAVTNLDLRGDTAYFVTHKDAPRFQVTTLDLAHPDKKAAVLVPVSEVVVTSLGVAKDALYVQDLDGGLGRLRRLPYGGGAAEILALPFAGAISAMTTDPRRDGAILQMTSWTKPPLWYTYDPKTGKTVDTKLAPPSPVDFSGVDSVEVKAKSADGTMVPLSIVYKKDIVLDGSHPTWLEGYGAYGITLDPAFSPTRLAWLERGGVFAVAHVRGGGEYGEDWHRGGMLATKQHTIDDFIACAKELIEKKYTSPAHLAGEGTSAGGITIGGAITQRPDLFGAALIRVGDSNALRAELMESGPANIPEFGTVKTEEGFKALSAMDAYQHVKASTAYPAVLLTTGSNDPRVAPWQAGKMTARLQASTSSGKPILMRVDYDAGHGMGSTKTQRDEELADEEAFLFWQLGVPEFQPK